MSRSSSRPLVVVLSALVTGLIVVLPPQPASSAVSPPKDIIFSLDGSGSIDSTDWQLQKDGYAAAVEDAVAFPLDGSVSVGVSQWSSPAEARVEIASRVISSQSDVDALVQQILQIEQIGNSTDPVSGLELATRQLTDAGRAGADWRVCMSSDGTQNDGTGDLATAASAARSAGVDRFSVVGIEDFGNGNELRSFYRPVVFGGGTFTLARNTAEFANLIIGGCLNRAVDLVGLEVTQGTQNWVNDVTLVASKDTVVRAFVEVAAGTDPQRVSGRLIGRRDGVELPGSPLLATNPGASVLAGTDVAGRRRTLNASLNFVLPADWRSGDVELELDGAGTAVQCAEAAGPTPDDCVAGVSFTPGSQLQVQVLGIPYTDGSGRHAPSAGDLQEQVRRLESILPASQVSATYREFTSASSGKPHVSTVNSRISKRRYLDGCFSFLGCQDLYYGLLEGTAPANASGGRTIGQAAGIPADVASSYLEDLDTAGAGGRFRNTIAHEVGHTLGLNHDVTSDVSGGYKVGDCGEVASTSAPTYPYYDTRSGRRVPLLGRLGASTDEAIWGLDTRYVRGDVNGLAVIDPAATYDIMGYCDGAGQGGWPSDYSWDLLRDGLSDRVGTRASARGTSSGSHLILSGVVDSLGGAALDSPARADGTFPQDDAGDYSAELLDAAGAVLRTAFFDVDLDAGPDSTVQEGSFVVALPQPAAPVAQIRIRRGTTVLTTKRASAAAPTVVVTEPEAGATVDTDELRVSWQAGDTDGDALAHGVRYSADGGASWQTLAVDLDTTTLVVPRDELGASTNAIIEVQVSDGVNVAVAQSPPFTVVGSGPQVSIQSPHDGDVYYTGVQQVLLDAAAVDNEDGDVGDSVTWSSDLDGVIAYGASATVGADQLSEGTHVLTATATDAGGETGAARVSIKVFRVAQPDAVPVVTVVTPTDRASYRVDQSIPLAATALDEEDGDLSTGVRWTAEDGRLLLAGSTGVVPPAVLGVGQHVLTATVTDTAGQRSEDQATIEVTAAPVTPGPTTGPPPSVTPTPVPVPSSACAGAQLAAQTAAGSRTMAALKLTKAKAAVKKLRKSGRATPRQISKAKVKQKKAAVAASRATAAAVAAQQAASVACR